LIIILTCELTKVVVLNYSGKNEKTSKTVANRCKNLQRNEKKTKNERPFDVTLGYSITVRDVWASINMYLVVPRLHESLDLTGVTPFAVH